MTTKYKIEFLNDPDAISNGSGGTYTFTSAINSSGEVVGDFLGAGGFFDKDFLYDNGQYTTLQYGGLSNGNYSMSAFYISDSGTIIGNTREDDGYHTFIYNGTFTDIGNMSVSGVNSELDIVGGNALRTFGDGKTGTIVNPLAIGYNGSESIVGIDNNKNIVGNYTQSGDSSSSAVTTNGFILTGGQWVNTANYMWNSTTSYHKGDIVFDETLIYHSYDALSAYIAVADNVDFEPNGNDPYTSQAWEYIRLGATGYDLGDYVYEGNITTLSFNGAATYADFVNASGKVVGHSVDSNNVRHTFIYSGGSYTELNDPNAQAGTTIARGITAGGKVYGNYTDISGNLHAFVYQGGAYADLVISSEPTALNYGFQMNDAGQILAGKTLATPDNSPDAAIVWSKAVSGDFTVGKNWTGGVAPGATDYASITPAGTYTVTSAKDQTVTGLVTASGATLSITAGTFTVTDGTDTVTAGTVVAGVNAGKIVVSPHAKLEIDDTFANSVTGSLSASGTGAVIALNSATIVGGTLKSSGGGEIDALAGTDDTLDGTKAGNPVNNTGVVVVDDSASLILKGVVNNTGTIELHGNNNPTELLFTGSFTLQGAGGKVTLSDSAANTIDSQVAATLTNLNNTISGAGTIGDKLNLVNQAAGVINGSEFNHALVLDTGANKIANAGTLEGSAAGGLAIDSQVSNSNLIEALGFDAKVDITADITNTSKGVIFASGTSSTDAAHVDLHNITITGGTLKTAGTGVINVVANADVTLDGSGKNAPVNNAGLLSVADNASLTLLGTVNNTGTIALQGGADDTGLIITDDFTLQGLGGKVTLSDSDHNTIATTAAAATLTNLNNTISGAGAIGTGDDKLSLVNQTAGVITGSGITNALVLDTGVNNAIINLGILSGTAAGGLEIDSAVFNANLIEALGSYANVDIVADVTNPIKGVILASGIGAHVDLHEVTITGGTLKTALGGTIETVAKSDAILDGSTKGVPVNNTGLITVVDDSSLTLKGTVNNTGTIALLGTTHPTGLLVTGAFSLQGVGGKVTMSDSDQNTIASDATATLTNVNNTISGAGTIGTGDTKLTLVNQVAGIINGSGLANALVLDMGINTISNLGILAGTSVGGLETGSAVANANLIEALGIGAKVVVEANVTNTSKGVILASGPGAHVDLDNISVIGGTLKTAAGGVINSVDATLDGTHAILPVTNAGMLAVFGSSLTLKGAVYNTGTIALNGTNAMQESTLDVSGSFLLQGAGGKVTLADADETVNSITSGGNAATLTNVNNTISGAGTIGDSHLTLINQAAGIINGTKSSNYLALDTGANTITNAGILEGTGAGGLEIDSAVSNSNLIEALGSNACVVLIGAVTNTSTGVILASGTSAHVGLYNATISGGTLKTAAGGVIETAANADATLNGMASKLTNAGSFVVTGNTSVTLEGAIANTGKIQVGDSNAAATIVIGADTTLSGTGQMTFSDVLGNAIETDANVHKFTNSSTINGAVSLDDTLLTLANTGVINSTGTNGIDLHLGAVSNSGTLEASANSDLTITDTTITNTVSGVIKTVGANSDIDLDHSVTIIGGTVSLVAGSFLETSGSGSSTISGAKIVNAGTIWADDGSLTISGSTITNAGVVLAGGSDITINGAVANTGTLDVDGTSILKITGALTGTGKLLIDGQGDLDLGATSANAVTFDADADGKLTLHNSTAFTAKISGFSVGDAIDLADLNFASLKTPTYAGTATGGTLTISDATHTAHIALTGNYLPPSWAAMDKMFVFADDGSGGIAVTLNMHSFTATPGVDDSIIATAGKDILDGGDGNNTVSYANSAFGVGVDLSLTTGQLGNGDARGDILSNFQNVTGSALADTLKGDANANTLTGGLGKDTLTGGGGADNFQFKSVVEGGDEITDFSQGSDHILISKIGFGIAAAIAIDAANTAQDFGLHYLVNGANGTPSATETGHGQFLFNESTSQLFWDDDGKGAHAAKLVATLDNVVHTVLTAHDFLLTA